MQLTGLDRATEPQSFSTRLLREDRVTPVPLLVMAASLLMAIAVIHLQDQGGLLGDQSPAWLKYGYYAVEIGAIIGALLVIRGKAMGWVLGVAISLGPLAGYILSRTTGLPGDAGDVGNWGYLLGTVSLSVEGAFIVLAVMCLTRIRRAGRPTADVT